MRNKFPGKCDWCAKVVEPGQGHFQSIGSLPKDQRVHFTYYNFTGKWLIRCNGCIGRPNSDLLRLKK